MNEPLVSIIMPAYNAEKYIEEAIQSVQNQSYQNWELLICDDCSTDNTVKIIENKIKKDLRIKLFKLRNNSGAAIARNFSIEQSNGKYISFLDSDDIWKSNKLKSQIEFMEKNNYNFTCTYYDKIDGFGNSSNEIIKYKSEGDFNELLLNCPGNSTVIYRAQTLGKIYVQKIKKRNDYLMWFNVIQKSGELHCVTEVLSSHRETGTGLSSNKITLVKYHWKIYRNELNLSFFKSLKITIYWIFKGVIRKTHKK